MLIYSLNEYFHIHQNMIFFISFHKQKWSRWIIDILKLTTILCFVFKKMHKNFFVKIYDNITIITFHSTIQSKLLMVICSCVCETYSVMYQFLNSSKICSPPYVCFPTWKRAWCNKKSIVASFWSLYIMPMISTCWKTLQMHPRFNWQSNLMMNNFMKGEYFY